MKKKQNGASTFKVQVFGRQGKLNVLTFLDVNFFSSVQKNRGTAFATVAYVLLQVIGSRRRVLSWTCRILWEKCCICFVLLNRSCLLLRSHVKHQKYSPLSLSVRYYPVFRSSLEFLAFWKFLSQACCCSLKKLSFFLSSFAFVNFQICNPSILYSG